MTSIFHRNVCHGEIELANYEAVSISAITFRGRQGTRGDLTKILTEIGAECDR